MDETLSESTTCMRYIDPKIADSDWDLDKIERECQIAPGRIIPDGKRGRRHSPLKADYILKLENNFKIAVIEAKAYDKSHDEGMSQAINYAEKLGLKFAYSTNGKKIEEYDFITKQQKTIHRFPTPQDLYKRQQQDLSLTNEQMDVLIKPFERDAHDHSGKVIEPRYYQEIAVNSAITAIINNKKRILLTLATGTGKTFIAYQLAKKLWKKDHPKPKILFLADRTVLLDQAKNSAFAGFGESRHKIQRKRETAYDMYFALYQALDAGRGEEELYNEYPSDFFDYVIIDECHRGGSTESGDWRKILDYFSNATHIGMTATPKHDDVDKDTYDYFGQPVYTYSLKQGIEDGFLAPYMIHRVNLELDNTGYEPKHGELDLDGKILEDKTYTHKDFDRILIVDERRKAVARHIVDFLNKNDQKYDKMILFCQTSEHAQAMTKLIRNESGQEHNYCVRIVSAEGEIGREHLGHFQNPNNDLPVIAVTSRLMSTGVDVPTCKIIALDKNINSMTEFKQIIGRGTRVFEPKGKMWFTILDYRKVTRLFLDPDWDGPPENITEEEQARITETKEHTEEEPKPEKPTDQDEDDESESRKIETYHIEGTRVEIMGEEVRIFDQSIDGNRLVSYVDYTGETVKRLVDDDERKLHNIWINPEKRKHFVHKLEERGVTFEHLREVTKIYKADAFDLLLNFAFNANTKTRLERVDSVKKRSFLEKYPEKAREVLEVILDHYGEVGYQELEGREVLDLPKFEQFGGPVSIIRERFTNTQNYDNAIMELTEQIYMEN